MQTRLGWDKEEWVRKGKRFIALNESGRSFSCIARAEGVSEDTVLRAMRRGGYVSTRKIVEANPALDLRTFEEYMSGMSHSQIARAHRRTVPWAYRSVERGFKARCTEPKRTVSPYQIYDKWVREAR